MGNRVSQTNKLQLKALIDEIDRTAIRSRRLINDYNPYTPKNVDEQLQDRQYIEEAMQELTHSIDDYLKRSDLHVSNEQHSRLQEICDELNQMRTDFSKANPNTEFTLESNDPFTECTSDTLLLKIKQRNTDLMLELVHIIPNLKQKCLLHRLWALFGSALAGIYS